MKTKFFQCAIMAIAVGTITITPSCKKVLDYESPSSSSPSTVFESITYTNAALIGVYNRLGGDNGYGNRISMLYPQTADDFKTSGNYSSADRRGISMYGASSDNADLYNPFVQLYSGVERANLCIKYIPASNLYANGTAAEKALMKRYYGEALALRAQFLFELVRNWGDVPVSFVPAADAETLNGPNADHEQTLTRIIDDLKIAAELVPWRTELTEYGSFRFTKGAIKGLRARIALARGGWSLKISNHTMTQNSDRLTYYKIAQEECLDIMTRRGDHNLNPVYENIFKSLHTAARIDNNHELMFEVAAFGSGASTDSKLGYYNGVRFAAASSFGQGGGGINAIPTYFYEFDQSKDTRRDVTIGVFEINANSKKIMNAANSLTDGKFRKSWTTFNNTSAAQNFAVNWPIIRFADVLLMFAEADNEITGSPSAQAKAALQEVQKRAYLGNEADIPVTPTLKKDFFDAIVKERLLEFGGEGIRKYDLIRWNLIQSKFVETREKLGQFMAGTGAYKDVPAYLYAKENTFNQTASVAEVASLDLLGGTPNIVFFSPGLGTSSAPSGSGYTVKNWRAAVTNDPVSGAIAGTASGFATYFEANKKEVFPYPKSALIENPVMVQNFGY